MALLSPRSAPLDDDITAFALVEIYSSNHRFAEIQCTLEISEIQSTDQRFTIGHDAAVGNALFSLSPNLDFNLIEDIFAGLAF